MKVLAAISSHSFALPLLLVLAVAFLVATLVLTMLLFCGKKIPGWLVITLGIAAALLLTVSVLCMTLPLSQEPTVAATEPAVTEPLTEPLTEPSTQIEETSEPETSTEPEAPELKLAPHFVAATDPANWNIQWTVFSQDRQVESYSRPEPISFGAPEEYFPYPGVVGFRGNHYRNGAAYGYVDVQEETLEVVWRNLIGSLNDWPGVGWTGEPIVVQWPEETRSILGLYEDKKTKDGLVEVIFAGLDGYIHCYDLEDGSETRQAIWIGQNLKCSPALDPRGYPMMFVGSGTVYHGNQKMYMINLITNEVMVAQDGADMDAPRYWFAFDSSPLISGDTDTLIWPGESGAFYTIKLNTEYDPAAGTLSIAPETEAKAVYNADTPNARGFEASVVVVDSYAFLADNGGLVFCVDLNTMELVWAQDCHDDINATPIFQWEADGSAALYIVTSMEFNHGTTYAFKLNAQTGEILWQHEYHDVVYDEGVSGGALSTPILGRAGTTLEGKLILTMAKTPYVSAGVLSILDTETGDVLYEEVQDYYVWSSPVDIYDEEGNGYFVLCDSAGNMELRNAEGKVVYTLPLTYNFEASPAVYEDMLLIGSRSGYIYGVKIR